MKNSRTIWLLVKCVQRMKVPIKLFCDILKQGLPSELLLNHKCSSYPRKKMNGPNGSQNNAILEEETLGLENRLQKMCNYFEPVLPSHRVPIASLLAYRSVEE